jgi:hypothetical protein
LPDYSLTEALGIGSGPNWQNPLVPIAKAAEPTEQNQIPSLQGSTGTPTTSFGDLNRSTGTQPSAPPPSGDGKNPPGYVAPGPSPEELARQRYEGEQREAINVGWDSYINQLNDMLNIGLPGQRTAQEGLAKTSYEQSIGSLGTQKATSEADVTKQQAINLKDIAENVRNLFQSGNVYLGARGAGDSSAADQYSYALTKLGTKARGDIMAQVSDRMARIKDIYDSEMNRFKSEYDLALQGIALWFNEAQNQVRQSVGRAGVGRAQDLQALSTNLYNIGLAELGKLQSEFSNRRKVLESWAMNNSKNTQELAANMRGLANIPQFAGLTGFMPQMAPSGTRFAPVGYGATTNEERDLFGNPIRR